jgi:two-component system chemotaxis response regulator CheB
MSQCGAVVIGVSAGGMAALRQLVSQLPAGFTTPVVIVQHIAANSDSYLVEYLGQHSVLRVKEAEDKEALAAGTIYMAPPGYHVLIDPGPSLSLSVDPPVSFARPSVDILFESAAVVMGRRAIGVVLTGANADGAAGLALIKKKGGTAIVQNPETAEAAYMPRAALAATAVDYVIDIGQVAPLLVTLCAGAEKGEGHDA